MTRHSIHNLPILLPLAFIIILAFLSFSIRTYAVSQLSIKKLADSKAQSSYVGSPATISITIRKGVSVYVYVPKSSAYAASAIAIYGDYDESRGKFIYISGGIGYDTKSWCSFTCFEKYDINVKSTSFNLKKYDEGDWYKFVAKGTADYTVTHCIWWISCSKKTVVHSLTAIAYVPKSRV